MVKQISLTKNQVALVDDEDFEYINQWKWYAAYAKNVGGYYASRAKHIGKIDGKYKQKIIQMHRLITDAEKGQVVDHINHNTLDNRRCNLRLVSSRQNSQNRKIKSSSKFPGVSWSNQSKKWKSCIYIDGNYHHLGFFDNELDAAESYKKACLKLGENVIFKRSVKMETRMLELIGLIKDEEINYIEKSHEVALAELDMKIVESDLHVKTDFKELGLTNQKQRDAYVLEQMAEAKQTILDLQNGLKIIQANIGAFKREFELNKLIMAKE